MTDPYKKSQALAEKTDKCRRLFNLPESEAVIQDYSCTWGMGKGRMYVTQNYVCWSSDITSFCRKIPFRKIRDIKQTRTLGLVGNSLTIEETETLSFGNLFHRDETYNLLLHLWKHPPNILSVPNAAYKGAKQSRPQESNGGMQEVSGGWGSPSNFGGQNQSPQGGNWGNQQGTHSSGHTQSVDTGGGGWGGGGWGWGQSQQLTARDVDTQTSENALRIAHDTLAMGIDTMDELEYQAEQIDRIESRVENIHYNLNRGERHLRGIESLGGHFINTISSDKKKGKPTYLHQDRMVAWAKSRPDTLDIPILLKMKDDSLHPASLCFRDTHFYCLKKGEKSPKKGFNWAYDRVDKVVCRARPLHLDLRFLREERFRLCSSYIQPIVNEFFFRVPSCNIIFEPGVPEFDYGSEKIVVTSHSREGDGVAFFGVKKSTADILGDDVDEDVKQAVRRQEAHVEEIGNLVGEMGQLGIAMGHELDRQIEQLHRVQGKVESGNERIYKNTVRV
eukprot:CAMPEP_0174250716 /NCGR_PEP_ID=MMETSP0439-20130205/801_1 /TAXON_ID=0 /ORGANISM="Stereomyxa ramosa, Strain Chinc5" /LENGTH=503 /DNA_ID=CAMNT_0015330857 /DNA_START=27 /DNA_END=1534 /DNA_ORIENTATION=+